MSGCIFIHSRGRVIIAKDSKAKVMHSVFKLSQAEVIITQYKSNVSVTNCSFELNSRAVLQITSSNGIFQKCTFHNNRIKSTTDLIRVHNSIIELKKCKLTNNSAIRGRILLSESNSTLKIVGTNFKYNMLQRVGMLAAHSIKLTIDNCTFLSNKVVKTGVLLLWYSEVEVFHTLEIRDNSVECGEC